MIFNPQRNTILPGLLFILILGAMLLQSTVRAQDEKTGKQQNKQQVAKEVNQRLAQARMSLNEGNYTAGLIALEGIPPKYYIPSYHYLKALLFVHLYRVREAKRILEDMKDEKKMKNSLVSRALWALGDMETLEKNYQKAIKHYRLSLSRDKVVVPGVKLCVLLYDAWGKKEMGRKFLVDAQARAFQKGNEFKKDYCQAVMAMMDAVTNRPERAKMEIEMTKLRHLPRRNAVIAYFLACASYLLDRKKQAMKYLEKALFTEPVRATTRLNIVKKIKRSRALKELRIESKTLQRWISVSPAEQPSSWTMFYEGKGPKEIKGTSWPEVTLEEGWKLVLTPHFAAASDTRDEIVWTFLSRLERWFSMVPGRIFPEEEFSNKVNIRLFSTKEEFRKDTDGEMDGSHWVWSEREKEFKVLYSEDTKVLFRRPEFLGHVLKRVLSRDLNHDNAFPDWLRYGLEEYLVEATYKNHLYALPSKAGTGGLSADKLQDLSLRRLLSFSYDELNNSKNKLYRRFSLRLVEFLVKTKKEKWSKLLLKTVEQIRSEKGARDAFKKALSALETSEASLMTALGEYLKAGGTK